MSGNIFHKVNAVFRSGVNRSGFPFADTGSLNMPSGMPVGISLNDIFNKFRANDLVIERYLSNYTSVSYQVDQTKIDQLNSCNVDISSRTMYADIYSSRLSRHLSQHHGPGSLAVMANLACVGTDCEDIRRHTSDDAFTRVNSTTAGLSAWNDVVDRVYTEQDQSGKITAVVQGYATGDRPGDAPTIPEAYGRRLPSLDNITYIFRKWRSGIGELDVFLPTSLNFHGHDCATTVTLKFNNGFFGFDEVYSAVVSQNSPSLLVNQSTYGDLAAATSIQFPKTRLGMGFDICLTVSGSDAQALKIIGKLRN